MVDRIFHYNSMIQSIVIISYLIFLNSIFNVAIRSIHKKESIQYISYRPMTLSKLADASV